MSETTADSHSSDSHASDHGHGHGGKARYEDISVPGILFFGLISIILTLVSIFFVKGLLGWWTRHFEEKRQAEILESPGTEQIEGQLKLLEGGEGTISIEEASKKVLEKYGKKSH